MSGWSITFDPFFSWGLIGLVAAVALALALYGLLRRVRGSWLRLGAALLLSLALCNPSMLREDRDPLPTVIGLVVDETDSQKFDGRTEQTRSAVATFKKLLERFPQFELREVNVKNGGAESGDASTSLFSKLKSAFQDVPPNQVGGVVMMTDGQVHDVPEQLEELGFDAPLHALISGSDKDRDRRISITRAPRFGIVGKSQEIVYTVDDTNIDTNGGLIEVQIFMDGELTAVERVLAGEEASFFFDVPHGGKNIIELRAESVEGEITTSNNQAFTVLDGVRENLRVLLVSGEPHAGERTWRNLLKSDASVDLVHFTILRPPEKQDGTPINQLSLIAFPTRELFIEKIDEFDLIIFDRYKRRGVLPVLYFDNIARYVQDGGAVLVAAGPEHAGDFSVYQTPLAPVQPVEPTGNVTVGPFYPKVSELGRRHPVTRGLDGLEPPGSEKDPNWSRWFRIIDTINPQGSVVMEGNNNPLLVLDRPGEGRIAMLMSDHVWLWARGFEGGGPHTQLLRRLGHWLMKEPELDEEALRAETNGDIIRFERQTLGDDPGELSVVSPAGKNFNLKFEDRGDGLFVAEHKAETLGLFRAANGELTALTHVGPTNPREYAQIVSTLNVLSPLVKQTGGLIARMGDNNADDLRIVPTRGRSATSGRGWIGLKTTEASVLKGVSKIPLLSGFLGVGLLLLMLAGMWAREGR